MPESLVGDREPPDAEKVFEALEARRVIEPRVAQLAALRGTTQDFDAIRKTIGLQRTNQSNWWQITQGNVLFHRLLWRAARNPELESAMRSIYRSLSGPLYSVLSHDEDSAPPRRASSCTRRRWRRSCAATPTPSKR
jgi:DNA-binding FadR family transcriptional regulator